jgi:hypothetical protein
MSDEVLTAVATGTNFQETYPNRIPEEIYDSSGGTLMEVWNTISSTGVWNSKYDTWRTTGFIFCPYGPTLNT